MKGLVTVVLATQLFAVAAFAQSTTPPDPSVGSSSPVVFAFDPVPQNAVVRILTPVMDEKFIHTKSVKVRFELVNPSSTAVTPKFLVQLDGDDPVSTTTMEQTFSGLTPGTHSISVQLIGADNTPASGSRADVQFVIAPKAATPPRPADTIREALTVAPEPAIPGPPQLAQIGVEQSPPNEIMAMSSPLPSAGSALPLISVIGFGVLVGGIASAMKTR
jgi:hypothetical protein